MRTPHFLLLLALPLSVGCLGRGKIRSAQQMIISNPENPATWVALGDAYRRGLQPKKARDAYRRALSLDEDNAEAQESLANMGSGRKPRIVRQAMREPENDEIWGDVGDYYASVGQRQEALSAYLYALSLDPDDSEWQSSASRYGGGEDVLRVMMNSLDENNDEALGDVGDVLVLLERTEEACEYYQRALTLDPTDNEWIRNMTSHCEGAPVSETSPVTMGPMPTGDTSAMQSYVLGNASLLIQLGHAYAVAGDTENASEYLHGALLLNPVDEKALLSYMAVTGLTKLEVMTRLLEEVPNNDELMGEMGDLMLELGRPDEALAHYRNALAADEDDTEWSEKISMLEGLQ